MGCFVGCFGTWKRRRQSQSDVPVSSIPPYSVLESGGGRKKVTFDSNVHVTVYASTDSLLDKEVEDQKHCPTESRSQDDSTVGSYPHNHRYSNCRDSDDDDDAVESEYEDSDLDDEIIHGTQQVWSETIPLESKDSTIPLESKDSTIPLESKDSTIPLESKDSTIPLESKDSTTPVDSPVQTTLVFNRNARDRSVYVHPVLNPVENLTQWKAVKSRGTSLLNPNHKENSLADGQQPRISFSPEPTFKQSSYNSKPQSKEMAVDASLSNWLVTPEITPDQKSSSIKLQTMTCEKSTSQGSNSVMSIEDRPILGALTLEELNQFSATSSSPRKSPSRSPDDMVLMGTVGTYWKHTGEANNRSYKGIPNTTSKYTGLIKL